MDNKTRKLVKTFPGLPPGAGIYDDGKFYNCAPGRSSQAIDHDDDCFYSTDPISNKLTYKRNHPMFKNVQGGFNLAGINIDDVTNVSLLERLMSKDMLGDYIAEFITIKQMSRRSNATYQKMIKARLQGNDALADRLSDFLQRRQKIGLYVVKNK